MAVQIMEECRRGANCMCIPSFVQTYSPRYSLVAPQLNSWREIQPCCCFFDSTQSLILFHQSFWKPQCFTEGFYWPRSKIIENLLQLFLLVWSPECSAITWGQATDKFLPAFNFLAVTKEHLHISWPVCLCWLVSWWHWVANVFGFWEIVLREQL